MRSCTHALMHSCTHALITCALMHSCTMHSYTHHLCTHALCAHALMHPCTNALATHHALHQRADPAVQVLLFLACAMVILTRLCMAPCSRGGVRLQMGGAALGSSRPVILHLKAPYSLNLAGLLARGWQRVAMVAAAIPGRLSPVLRPPTTSSEAGSPMHPGAGGCGLAWLMALAPQEDQKEGQKESVRSGRTPPPARSKHWGRAGDRARGHAVPTQTGATRSPRPQLPPMPILNAVIHLTTAHTSPLKTRSSTAKNKSAAPHGLRELFR
jgi:hypothetical protein